MSLFTDWPTPTGAHECTHIMLNSSTPVPSTCSIEHPWMYYWNNERNNSHPEKTNCLLIGASHNCVHDIIFWVNSDCINFFKKIFWLVVTRLWSSWTTVKLMSRRSTFPKRNKLRPYWIGWLLFFTYKRRHSLTIESTYVHVAPESNL